MENNRHSAANAELSLRAQTSFRKVVYVTGAASGMGRLAAQRMADAGATVVAVDVNDEGLQETARGREGIHIRLLDVTDTRAVAADVANTERTLGPIERVYAAAAILRTELLAQQDTETILRTMDVGYRGVVNVSKAVLPGLLARGRGDLVLFASIAGWVPSLHFGAYCAMKAAVVSFAEILAHENRDTGIRFLCVCPPQVDTPMIEAPGSESRLLRHPAFPPISPARVLDAIDRDLERGRLFCFPTRRSRLTWWVRRLTPGLLWRFAHHAEGL